jgi:guanylate kinase
MGKRMIIVSAPSGAGKTTIVKHLLAQKDLGLEFSISATSRPPRAGETDGCDYWFLSEESFREKIQNDDFIEWEEVYAHVLYGTLKSEVDRIFARDKNVIFDVDVVGGLNIKKMYGDKALAMFVQPPTPETLHDRLRTRSTEPEDKIAIRISKAEYELSFSPQFDIVLVNDKLEIALTEAVQIVRNFLQQPTLSAQLNT